MVKDNQILIIFLAIVSTLIFAALTHPRTVKLRGSCDVERINQLKPGYYTEIP